MPWMLIYGMHCKPLKASFVVVYGGKTHTILVNLAALTTVGIIAGFQYRIHKTKKLPTKMKSTEMDTKYSTRKE